jgi:uncharacterized protein
MSTLSPTSTRLRAALQQHKDSMTAILDSYGATNPRVFGSVARGDARENSDVDLLVDLLPGRGNELMRVAGISEELSMLLGVQIDVVADGLLRREVSATALADAVAV